MDNQIDLMEKTKMVKYLSFFLIVLTAFVGIKTINSLKEYSYIGKNNIQQNVVTVNGKGEVTAVPDIASFSFSVVEEGKTAKEAQDKATKKGNDVIAVIKAMGVDDKDIKTLSYNLSPKYEYTNSICNDTSCRPSKQTIVGYEVNQTIQVKIRKIDDAGTALAKIGALNVSNLSSLDFVIDDIDALQLQARDKAIADAKEKAGKLAKSLGVRLSRIINFYDQSGGPIYYDKVYNMSADSGGFSAPAVAPELPTGENKITSNVSITYEIE